MKLTALGFSKHGSKLIVTARDGSTVYWWQGAAEGYGSPEFDSLAAAKEWLETNDPNTTLLQ